MYVNYSRERPDDKARLLSVYFTKQEVIELISHLVMDKPLYNEISYHAGTLYDHCGKQQVHTIYIVKSVKDVERSIKLDQELYNKGL